MRSPAAFLAPSTASLVVLGCLVLIASPCFGQAFIERVEPPSVTRGQVTRVTLHGSSLEHVLGLWMSVPGKRVQARLVGSGGPGQVVFDVQVAAETPLGFHGLRLATKSGLSNAHIFLVDELATVPEKEMAMPAGTPPGQAPEVVALPAAIAGTCQPEDVDLFALDVKAGQEVTFEVIGSRLGKGFDPLVTVRNGRGQVVAEKDNDVGLFFDCRFAHRFEKAGRYTVEVRDSRFRGSNHWGYVLRMGRFPMARVAVPATVPPGKRTTLAFPQLAQDVSGAAAEVQPDEAIAGRFVFALKRPGDELSTWLPLRISTLPGTVETEPNDKPDQASAAAVPGVLHGLLGKPGDQDRFGLELKKGQLYQITAETRTLGSPADLELVLLDEKGKEISRADDSGLEDAHLNVTPPADGRYTLLVKEVVNWGGPEFIYAVQVQPRPPSLSLASGITRIALPQGTRQPLPLTLGRTALKGDVTLKLLGAPEGITMKIAEATDGTGEIDNYISCAASTPVGLYTLQVQAVLKSNAEITALASTRPLIDRRPTGRGPHGEPFELREDQRRLPPSLTERIALVVLPASPFDFEVVEPLVTLPRYQWAEFKIKTTRVAGFESQITFVARGGELEQDQLRKPRIRTAFPPATPENLVISGRFQSYVNTKTLRQRVVLTGTANHDGRQCSLTRTFDLEVVIAFRPAPAEKSVTLKPGATRKVILRPNRLAPFAGPVMLSLGQVKGLELPGSVMVPAGAESVEVSLKASSQIKPGKYKVSLSGIARVERFQESAGGESLEVVIEASDSNK